MKGKNTKSGFRSNDKLWLSIRVTSAEKLRLSNQAELAGISLSEFMRRNFFGGKPLVAHTDLKLLMELRRIGGLLKHHFVLLRETNASFEIYAKLDDAASELGKLIDKINWLFHDCKKD